MNACNLCGLPCGGEVCSSCKKSARYNKDLLSCPSPFSGDNSKETDTKLSVDYSAAILNYAAERHTDEISGEQLGSIINLGDLRNVDTDTGSAASCSELIFRRYGNCGKGCRSIEDTWKIFSIDDDGAKTDGLRYVRGVNTYGCPQYLDTPSNPNQFWYGGWRLDGDHRMFGYYQPKQANELPRDEHGNFLVGSYDPETKEPMVAPLPLDCILGNIMSGIGMDVTATFEKIQEYNDIGGSFNNATGEFDVYWTDWYYNRKRYVGKGHILGQVLYDTPRFDTKTGNMVYHIKGVRFDKVHYDTQQGAPSTAQPIYLTVKGIDLKTGAETVFFNSRNFNPNVNWDWDINQTISGEVDFTVRPGETQGPMAFMYFFLDWEQSFDDQGKFYVNFHNKLGGYSAC